MAMAMASASAPLRRLRLSRRPQKRSMSISGQSQSAGLCSGAGAPTTTSTTSTTTTIPKPTTTKTTTTTTTTTTTATGAPGAASELPLRPSEKMTRIPDPRNLEPPRRPVGLGRDSKGLLSEALLSARDVIRKLQLPRQGDTSTSRTLPSGQGAAIMAAMQKGNCWEEALEVFFSHLWPPAMGDRGVRVADRSAAPYLLSCCNMALNGMEKGKLWKQALQLLADMRQMGVPPDVISLNTTMGVCGRAGFWEISLRLLAEVRASAPPSVKSFGAAISACGRNSQWPHALWLLLTEMPRAGPEGLPVLPTRVACSAAISACAGAGQWEPALWLLGSMLRSRSPSPDVITFNATVTACDRGQQWQRALSVVELMRSQNLEATVITLNATLSACVKGRQWQAALLLFEEMLRQGGAERRGPSALSGGHRHHPQQQQQQQQQPPIGTWPRPDVVSFNCAVSACERAALWERAVWLLFDGRQQCSLRPDNVGYGAAIGACTAGGRPDLALGLFSELQAGGRARGGEDSSSPRGVPLAPDKVAYSAAMVACRRAADWQQAVSLLGELRGRCEADAVAFGAAASACSEGAAWAQALSLLSTMRREQIEPGEANYGAALAAFDWGGQWQRALLLLADMLQRSLRPGRASQWEAALESITWTGLVAHNAAVAACAQARRWEPALRVFAEMQREALEPSGASYGAALLALLAGGRQDEAALLYRQMLQRGVSMEELEELEGVGEPSNMEK
ncbi:unnamed protein product [Polarella glacialis]|uniref:Pentatricopeptide repeat-containing protein, chloroplastic n=1 Tax=Polarella glacialis TaxID=89957 RepID=A0A813HEM7_POLGL|nr:unnamed protein product [Polarella glacialis]